MICRSTGHARFRTTDSPSLRVASINVYSGNRRHADVLKFIAASRPDVVLLLEVTSDWRDLFDALATDYPFQKTALREDNFGIGLVSRLPWESVTVREIGSAEVPSIVAHLRWQGEPLTIIGTHPLPPGGNEMWRLRNEQFAALAELCRSQTDAVVVIGDLNATSWSAHFDTLLDGTRLRDSRAGFGVQASWPAVVAPAADSDRSLSCFARDRGPGAVHRSRRRIRPLSAGGRSGDQCRRGRHSPTKCALIRAGSQAGADQSLVVAGKDMPIGKRRMRPADTTAPVQLADRRLDELGTADLGKTRRRQLGDQQLPPLVEHPSPVAIANHVDRTPAGFGPRLLAFPNAIAGRCRQAAAIHPGYRRHKSNRPRYRACSKPRADFRYAVHRGRAGATAIRRPACRDRV